MANVLILGGGFGGMVAAERLAKTLRGDHQLTLVSRNRQFVFYPAMVRLAFGQCEPADVSFDLREALLDRQVRFIESEVARVNPEARSVTLAHGEITGEMHYDYLIFALGRRLATEKVGGFFEHAHHLLTIEAALRFGEAARQFKEGRAVIGYCPGARLDVPVYEAAFALSRQLEQSGGHKRARITLVCPQQLSHQLVGAKAARALRDALGLHGIEIVEDFPIRSVTAGEVLADDRRQAIPYDLLMLIPPFAGASAIAQSSLTDAHGFINVDRRMRAYNADGIYAVGDCVNFPGPKMGHMAVVQAEVAAANLAAEIEGRAAETEYNHELKYIIDAGGADSIYLRKELTGDSPTEISRGRFWSWAKRIHETYWQLRHD